MILLEVFWEAWGHYASPTSQTLLKPNISLPFFVEKRDTCLNFHFTYSIGGICFSVAKSCLTLCDLMDCSTPGFPVLHYLLEFAQAHVH